ncbi:MAG: hypothetical protein ACRDHF_07565 [Tepidiformaceae bacterium]
MKLRLRTVVGILVFVPTLLVAGALLWRTGLIGGDGAQAADAGRPPAAAKAPETLLAGSSPEAGTVQGANQVAGPALARTPDRLDLQRALEDASPFVRSLIEDGVITPDEYVQAAVASHTCTVEGTKGLEGIVVRDVSGPVGGMSFSFSAPTKGQLDAAGKVYEACHFEYFFDVQDLWNSAEGQARFAPQREKIAACMREAGASVPESPDNLDLFQSSEAFAGDDSLLRSCVLASY